MKVVVTGGAGYIGAHVVRLLLERGDEVVVVDDLSFGSAKRVGAAKLVHIDIAGANAANQLTALFEGTDAVIHVAARKQVGESVARPAWYYQQNIGGMANVLVAMEQAGVSRLVFSSSAATYGAPDVPTVSEDTPARPVNPYGETKLVGEWLCRDAAVAWGLRSICLRYFNVAGAGWADLGDPAALNLIPMVFDRLARGERPKVFGTDYPTSDGTCVRDYIHVADLAQAHLAALAHLDRDGLAGADGVLAADGVVSDVFNVGTGVGASVREVVDMIGEVSGLDATPDLEPRRPGDPPYLVGDPTRINTVLGWTASHDLRDIITSAWEAWQAGPRRIEV